KAAGGRAAHVVGTAAGTAHPAHQVHATDLVGLLAPELRVGLHADRVVLDARAQDREEAVAIGVDVLAVRGGAQVEIDDIDLVDFQVPAFQGIGGEVGEDAHAQHDGREGDPGPFQPLEDVLEQDEVERPDDQDVQDDEQGDVAEGDDLDVEVIELAHQVGA